MSGKLFNSSGFRTQHELARRGMMNSVVRKIQSVVDYRTAHKIVPTHAPRRSLQDTMSVEELKLLDSMVELKLVKAIRGIHYNSYTVDYEAWNAFWARIDKMG